VEEGEADHQRLGDAIQHRPEHDRERGAPFLATAGILALAATGATDQPITKEEHAAAGEDTQHDRTVPGRRADRLLDEVEGDRADQHPGTECHD
jgi:hypothetical protein